jgi:hypothetical protein
VDPGWAEAGRLEPGAAATIAREVMAEVIVPCLASLVSEVQRKPTLGTALRCA